jgi:hypothetical protein
MAHRFLTNINKRIPVSFANSLLGIRYTPAPKFLVRGHNVNITLILSGTFICSKRFE